jgi:D-glycerate 3-kinase
MSLKYSARVMSPLYVEVLAFCRAQLAQQSARPLVIGIQGPQGAGKSTMTRALLEALPALGLSGITVSIDDFYMTRAGQLAVAAAHPGNPYLEHRGYPGTHDIELGEKTLAGVVGGRRGGPSGPPITIPAYDKSAHGGRGDRAPVDQWRTVSMPLDLVFVEGWMLGFEPVAESSLTDPDLVAPNRALAEYARWYRYIDAWVVLRALDPTYVLTWRVEAEERMKASGKPGLSRADIEDYIRRFLPAYATWGGAPAGVPPERRLEVVVGGDRAPVGLRAGAARGRVQD